MRFAERREEDREENGGQISYRDSKNGSRPQRNFRGRIRFTILQYQPIRARGKRHVLPVFPALPYRYRAD